MNSFRNLHNTLITLLRFGLLTLLRPSTSTLE